MEFNYCYSENIVKNSDGTYTLTVFGDGVWESFADILHDIKDNNLNPEDCIIDYLGCFGDEVDDWCLTVPEVMNAVKCVNFLNYSDLTSSEKNVINDVINTYKIDKSKFKFVD